MNQCMFNSVWSVGSGTAPIYQQIADVVAVAVAEGRLSAGDRLPPQRDIASMAGVNLTTVTRAFADLQQRGLVETRAGRGSIISRPSMIAGFKSAPVEDFGFIDLSVNRPATAGFLDALAKISREIPRDRRYPMLQDFQAPEGPIWAREMLGSWATTVAGLSEPTNVIITNGAQHGLSCILGAITKPGDMILADEITYQGIGALCLSMGLLLVPVKMDRDGMLPDDFAIACQRHAPRAVFLVPTLHNPTTITLTLERREAIAAHARTHGVLIIEDDVYRAMKNNPPASFAALAPDITAHITSLSKCVAPGLRIGCVLAHGKLAADIGAILRINCWSTSPLNALVATKLIEGGHIGRIIADQREEISARQCIARQILSGFDVIADENAPHLWLQLPKPWRANVFAEIAAQHGVGVLSGEAFTDNPDTARAAVRINIAAARSREKLREALILLGEILNENHPTLP